MNLWLTHTLHCRTFLLFHTHTSINEAEIFCVQFFFFFSLFNFVCNANVGCSLGIKAWRRRLTNYDFVIITALYIFSTFLTCPTISFTAFWKNVFSCLLYFVWIYFLLLYTFIQFSARKNILCIYDLRRMVVFSPICTNKMFFQV